jgi:hypothetical protein
MMDLLAAERWSYAIRGLPLYLLKADRPLMCERLLLADVALLSRLTGAIPVNTKTKRVADWQAIAEGEQPIWTSAWRLRPEGKSFVTLRHQFCECNFLPRFLRASL